MATKTATPAEPKPQIAVPDHVPFGVTLLTGKRRSGKTLAALNSPWQPVHIIDTENSSEDYHQHQDRLIALGIIPARFTRAKCTTWASFGQEVSRITGYMGPKADPKPGVRYGTIILDTAGQATTWTTESEFNSDKSQAQIEKQIQLVWGRARDRIRNMLLMLVEHCDLLILTAHERKFQSEVTPRLNPAALELTSLTIRLTRDPNAQLPDAEIAGRLPFFPPRIPKFTLLKLLPYVEHPADYDHLTDDQKVLPDPDPVAPSPALSDDDSLES